MITAEVQSSVPCLPSLVSLSSPLPVAKPSLGEAEAEAARRAILSGWVTQGPEVAAFEAEFADYVGANHACAVSSCTTALHLALLGLDIGAGDEVVTVSHSYIATANAIRYCGAIPVFVDVDPQTYNLDPDKLEAAITPHTKAILTVHQIGLPCDLQAICDIAARHDLPVIEDAACAVGSEICIDGEWEKIGRPRGIVACFSFHPRKILTTGDGGMITTNDAELDKKFRLLRQHGMSVSDRERHGASTIVFEEYPCVGFNYRMTDIQAAVGRVQLQRLPDLLAERRELAGMYTKHLRGIAGIEPPCIPSYARSNYQSYAVRITPCYPMGRDAIMQILLNQSISTRRGIMNAHQEPAYADPSCCRVPTDGLPHSKSARDNILLLPLFPGMTEADIARVCAALRWPGQTR